MTEKDLIYTVFCGEQNLVRIEDHLVKKILDILTLELEK